jgi:energy-coupling factor transporter ATP-binding protein EcfA2
MKIRRSIAYRFKSIINLDHSLYDDWQDKIVDGLMLIGPNGSGKSTLLEGIASLWDEWGYWLDAVERNQIIPVRSNRKRGEPFPLPGRHPVFNQPNFGLLALELVDLDPKSPVWLAIGGRNEIADLKGKIGIDESGTYLIAAVGQSRNEQGCLEEWGLDWPGGPKDTSWLSRWAGQRRRSLLGMAELPNVLYFEPDNRQLLAPRGTLELTQDLQDPPLFNWIARYAPATRRAGHLSSMLYRMQVTDPGGLKVILDDINTYLRAKRVEGFAPTGDLEVTIGVDGEQAIKHLVYGLSSGERQVFIFVAMLRRWLHKGGLVLIDEPELHLHPSWRGALMAKLQRIVTEQEGQLVITCQSERMWRDYYRRTPERIELGEQAEVQEE